MNQPDYENTPMESFDETHAAILDRYSQDLPKPSPSLKISLVIPALAELKNGHIWELLISLLKQKDTETFEVLYVVNAPKYYYKKLTLNLDKIDEEIFWNEIDRDSIKDRLEENNQIITILNLIKVMSEFRRHNTFESTLDVYRSQLDALNLESWQKDLILKIVDKLISIYAIDASTENNAIAFSFDETPIGVARDIGCHVAYSRLPNNGYIDFIDGDCILTRDYFSDLESRLDSNPGYVLKPTIPEFFEIPREIENEPEVSKRIRMLIKFIRQHFIYAQFSRGVNGLHQVTIDRTDRPAERIHIGGPLLMVRKDVIRLIGGYDKNIVDEDFHFAAKVLRNSSTFKISDKPVIIFDRSRPDSTDGFGKVEEDDGESYLDKRSKRFLLINKYTMLALNEEIENLLEISDNFKAERKIQYHKQFPYILVVIATLNKISLSSSW